MTVRSALQAVAGRRLEIDCLFPECPNSWRFEFGHSEEQTRQARIDDGWYYQTGVPTSLGLAQGWICGQADNHFIDGNERLIYTRETIHG